MGAPPWTGLDVRHFVALSEVARTGSFTAAARALGYTQSALSQQIARFERLLGHELVHRTPGARRVVLTAAGRVLLHHADALTATLRRAAADVDALGRGLAGVLRVGCFESVGSTLLPAALATFLDAFPGVRIELTELADDGELLERLEQDRLDLTFVVFPLTAGPFASATLLTDPYRLVVAEDAAPAGPGGEVSLDAHPELSLVTYGEMREVHSLEARLGRPASGRRVVFRSNHSATLLNLARLGHVAAVLPDLAIPRPHPGLRVLPLARTAPRVIGIAWHHDRPPTAAATAFVHAVERAAHAGPDRRAGLSASPAPGPGG